MVLYNMEYKKLWQAKLATTNCTKDWTLFKQDTAAYMVELEVIHLGETSDLNKNCFHLDQLKPAIQYLYYKLTSKYPKLKFYFQYI